MLNPPSWTRAATIHDPRPEVVREHGQPDELPGIGLKIKVPDPEEAA